MAFKEVQETKEILKRQERAWSERIGPIINERFERLLASTRYDHPSGGYARIRQRLAEHKHLIRDSSLQGEIDALWNAHEHERVTCLQALLPLAQRQASLPITVTRHGFDYSYGERRNALTLSEGGLALHWQNYQGGEYSCVTRGNEPYEVMPVLARQGAFTYPAALFDHPQGLPVTTLGSPHLVNVKLLTRLAR
jgi:hypothetical protein